MHAGRLGSRFKRISPLLGVGLIAGGLEARRGPAQSNQTECKSRRGDDEKGPGFLGVFLDANSIEKVKEMKGESARVEKHPHAVFHLHPDPAAQASFRPLCGAKAELRVKGIGEDKATKQRILVVDVWVGDKTVKAEGFVPTISFGSQKWGGDVSDLLGSDLARRLEQEGVLRTKATLPWNGELPAQVLDGVKYHATDASYEKVNDVVLTGTVCTSTEYDIKKLQCVAGAREEDDGDDDDDDDDDDEDEGDEPAECPLCTYMMNSPCRDVFSVFKECIDKAEDTNEKEDLTECEPFASKVHGCIIKYNLFGKQEDEHEEEGAEEGEEGAGKHDAHAQASKQ